MCEAGAHLQLYAVSLPHFPLLLKVMRYALILIT
jgi:hypothetical protein